MSNGPLPLTPAAFETWSALPLVTDHAADCRLRLGRLFAQSDECPPERMEIDQRTTLPFLPVIHTNRSAVAAERLRYRHGPLPAGLGRRAEFMRQERISARPPVGAEDRWPNGSASGGATLVILGRRISTWSSRPDRIHAPEAGTVPRTRHRCTKPTAWGPPGRARPGRRVACGPRPQ